MSKEIITPLVITEDEVMIIEQDHEKIFISMLDNFKADSKKLTLKNYTEQIEDIKSQSKEIKKSFKLISEGRIEKKNEILKVHDDFHDKMKKYESDFKEQTEDTVYLIENKIADKIWKKRVAMVTKLGDKLKIDYKIINSFIENTKIKLSADNITDDVIKKQVLSEIKTIQNNLELIKDDEVDDYCVDLDLERILKIRAQKEITAGKTTQKEITVTCENKTQEEELIKYLKKQELMYTYK